MKKTITISEIYGTVIQGEGHLTGMPTIFVRTGSCDFRCRWCDSMHAVDPRNKHEWRETETEDVLDRLLEISRGFPVLVSLSGGNPALQPLGDLIERGGEMGYPFALETQGTVEREWFAALDHLVLSPKGPSSGMRFDLDKLLRCVRAAGRQTQVALKVVVFDEEDYQFARALREELPELPMYLQAGTPQRTGNADVNTLLGDDASLALLRTTIAAGTMWLAERVAEDRWFENVRVGCQLHTLIWGDARGV